MQRKNLQRWIRRDRIKNVPLTPRSLEELDEIPESRRGSVINDNLLMYDSRAECGVIDSRVIMTFGSSTDLLRFIIIRYIYDVVYISRVSVI